MAVDEAALTRVVERHLGPGLGVTGLRHLTGGASNETWSFDVAGADEGAAGEALILRVDRRGDHDAARREARLLELAAEAGVPVPAVRFVLDPDDGVGAGYVMARVEGETIPRRILRDESYATARELMARQVGEVAARVHAVPVAALPGGLPGYDGHDHPAAAQIEQYRSLLDAFGEPHPVFELGLRWLEQEVPPFDGPVLVHGDFRNGNFMVGPEGLRAVLDWELAHLGDPMEDLGWLCVRSWRFRQIDRPVGGFGLREDLFAGYESVSGRPVDPAAVHYWEVFGTLKWGVMCIVQAFTHLNGVHRSVELAAIGRRVCETEHHLLQMID